MRGASGELAWASAGMASEPGDGFQVADAKSRTFGCVGQAFDLPAVRQHDLLNHSQAQAGSFFLSGEIRFENVGALFRRNARAVVPHLDEGLGGAGFAGDDLD